jgi:hypothetical protein
MQCDDMVIVWPYSVWRHGYSTPIHRDDTVVVCPYSVTARQRWGLCVATGCGDVVVLVYNGDMATWIYNDACCGDDEYAVNINWEASWERK